MTERPILMFDSGIGGLTVLREARVLMPDRRFVYVADDAAFPYGDWEEEALKARLIALFGELLERCKKFTRLVLASAGLSSASASSVTLSNA